MGSDETVRKVLRQFKGRALLADEVGLGKTIEACLVLKEYWARGMVRKALVLAPPSLVSQWKGELTWEHRFKAGSLVLTARGWRPRPSPKPRRTRGLGAICPPASSDRRGRVKPVMPNGPAT